MKKQIVLLVLVSALFLLLSILQVGCKEKEDVSDSTQLPELSTLPITEISSQSASCGGEITYDGGAPIISRGLVWSISENPTTEINENMTSDGGGTGKFTSALTELSPYSTYYVRAYAKNSKGTNYGNQVEFETLPDGAYGTVTDIDGNVYWTVAIGDYEWMAQNLRTTRYADGTPILTGLSDEEWENTTEGAYRVIPYDDTIGGARFFDPPMMFDNYGYLFNGFVIELNPCPEGWFVPTTQEWNTMMDVVKLIENVDDNTIGNALKSCRQVNSPLGGGCKTDWHPRWDEHPSVYGTSKVFFLGLPAGEISSSGVYGYLGTRVTFWMSSGIPGWLHRFSLLHNNGRVLGGSSSTNHGYCIRCIREIAKK